MEKSGIVEMSRKDLTEAAFRNIIVSLVHAGASKIAIVDGTDITAFHYKIVLEGTK